MIEAHQMKPRRGSACRLRVAGVLVITAAALFLSGCADCDAVLKHQASKDGRFVAKVKESGACEFSLNTIATVVVLTDTQAWIRPHSAVFSGKGLSDVELFWLGPNQLKIQYTYPGQVPERIYQREDSLGDVSIVYEEIPWNGNR